MHCVLIAPIFPIPLLPSLQWTPKCPVKKHPRRATQVAGMALRCRGDVFAKTDILSAL